MKEESRRSSRDGHSKNTGAMKGEIGKNNCLTEKWDGSHTEGGRT